MAANFTIRAEQSEDAAAIVDIRNQPLVRWGTLAMPYTTVEFYKAWSGARPKSDVALVACLEGHVVAAAGLIRPTNPRCAHKASLGIMVHDAHQGRGAGRVLMAALTGLADEWLNLRRLELHVFTDNLRAIALYESFGFVMEGTFRADAFRAGAYADTHAMARLRPP